MSDPEHAFVFVDNHDNQRGHGGGGSILVCNFPFKYTCTLLFYDIIKRRGSLEKK